MNKKYSKLTAFALAFVFVILNMVTIKAQIDLSGTVPVATAQADGTIKYSFEIVVPVEYPSTALEVALEVPQDVHVNRVDFQSPGLILTDIGPTIDSSDGYVYASALSNGDKISGDVRVLYDVTYSGDEDNEVTLYVRYVMHATLEEARNPERAARYRPDYPIVLNESKEEPEPTVTPGPTQPTEPSVTPEPTVTPGPTQPTEPSVTPEPTEPTQPTVTPDPTQPTQPTEPTTETTQVTDPSGVTTQPTEPTTTTTQDTDPSGVTTEPTEPTTEVTQVSDPTESTEQPTMPTSGSGDPNGSEDSDSTGGDEDDDPAQIPKAGENYYTILIGLLILTFALGATSGAIVYRHKGKN